MVMNYNLNNLGSNNFEHMVQALCRKIIGAGLKIYGAGADGQREAAFEGRAPYPSEQERWDGYWVVQAKFKYEQTRTPDYLWLEQCFKDEMNRFSLKKQEGKEIPDNYLFFTNVVLTPMLKKGIKDKMDELAKSYAHLIPHIHIIGYDEICRMLDCHRDVASTYASCILSGDILSYLYDEVRDHEIARQNTFLRFLTQSFKDDYCSRMEQAGQVSGNKVSIDKVYVDLLYKRENSDEQERFIEKALEIGNGGYRFSYQKKNTIEIEHIPVGMGRRKSEPSPNKCVVKGSAGQGKSTVCQYLAQIYRACFLNNFTTTYPKEITAFMQGLTARPTCLRVPIRIELRLYSAWIVEREKENKSTDLITYISEMIADKANEKFDNQTLRDYFKKYAWAFFFDGLDEVPESSNRQDVMSGIENFIDIELAQADTDAMFYATTRPEGYVGEFSPSEYTHINLQPFDKEGCFTYLEKLIKAMEDNTTQVRWYLQLLKNAWENEQTRLMMRTPLQATIMAILVRTGGEPPRDKYTLFKEYFDTIIKREKQKGVDTILNSNQALVQSVYYLLGYELQKRSATTENSDALISEDRMRALIQKQLIEDGIPQAKPQFAKLLSDAYAMIVNRINFASEIKEGHIGFAIRSMQEFLAAEYIVRNVQDKELPLLFRQLAQSAYWRNTFIFIVECIQNNRPYYVDILIDTVLGELNGDALAFQETSPTASIYFGSQVAFDLLSTNIFKNKPKYENKLCKYIDDYCKLQPQRGMIETSLMSENVKEQLVKYLISMEENKLLPMHLALMASLSYDEKCYNQLKERIEKHRVVICQYVLEERKSFPICLLPDILRCLEEGRVLNTTVHHIAHILQLENVSANKRVEKTLFKMAVKATNRLISEKEGNVAFIEAYFDCKIPVFRRFAMSAPYTRVAENEPFALYFRPRKIDTNEFMRFLSVAESLEIESLELLLVLGRGKYEDYVEFAKQLPKYITELEEMDALSVFRRNAITDRIVTAVKKGDTAEFQKIIDVELKEGFLRIPEIKMIDEYLLGTTTEIHPSYVFRHNYFKSNKHIQYEEIRKRYAHVNVREYPRLCEALARCYGNCFEEAYDKYDSTGDKTDLEALKPYLQEALEFVQLEDGEHYSYNFVYAAFLMFMTKREYALNSDICFKGCFVREDRIMEEMLEKENLLSRLSDYIAVTENETAIESFCKTVYNMMDYRDVRSVDWRGLENIENAKLSAMRIVCMANSAEEIETVIPLLEADDNLSVYIFNFIDFIRIPTIFLPLYMYYLKKFREKKDAQKITICENKIYEIVSNIAVFYK